MSVYYISITNQLQASVDVLQASEDMLQASEDVLQTSVDVLQTSKDALSVTKYKIKYHLIFQKRCISNWEKFVV